MSALEKFDLIFVPGYGNSTGSHWQAEWFGRFPHVLWAEQETWDAPNQLAWIAGIHACVAKAERPIVFVSHSLGGLLISAWADMYSADVAGAFLVVPPDASAASFPKSIRGFSNPTKTLAFPSVLIATRNDPYSSFETSKSLARALGSRFVDAGDKGHINPASGYGPWVDGEHLLREFCAQLATQFR